MPVQNFYQNQNFLDQKRLPFDRRIVCVDTISDKSQLLTLSLCREGSSPC
jgi:hypothetical protein